MVSEKGAFHEVRADEIPAALLLSAEAEWNQTADDWGVFIGRGRTFGWRADDGRLVATAAALPYSSGFGVVAMVLVTAAWRHRGLASSLVDLCVDVLRREGLTPMLDATAAGATVYGRMGFRPLLGFDRWVFAGRGSAPSGRADADADADADTSEIAALDMAANGAGRRFLFEDFLARSGTRAWRAADGSGFALIRRGRGAGHIRPVVAASTDAALELIARAGASVEGPLFIDVPDIWTRIGEWLRRHGGRIQRSFSRMALDRSKPFGDPGRLFAVAGPEFG